MKKALLCLIILASAILAGANNNPNVVISPSPVAVLAGNTQQFVASFDDSTQVVNCSWLTTGAANAVQTTGVNTATFAAGS